MRVLIWMIFATALFVGCSTDRPMEEFFAPNDVGELVVDAILIVDEPLPRVFLSRTTAPGEVYDDEVAAESAATVNIVVLPDGPTVVYGELSKRGLYVPLTETDLEVQPNTTYELRVVTSKGEVLRASTMTPERFAVTDWVLLEDAGNNVMRTLKTFAELQDNVYFAAENRLVYKEGLLEGRFVRAPGTPGFHVGIFSLDLTSDYVIDPAFFDDEDFEALERTMSSPPLEGTDEYVRLPWFAIFFQGRYKIKVYAVDENWFELILTLPEFNGGFGGNIGENFSRPEFNVEGGIGLFGSASVDSIGFFVLPRP